MGSILSRMVAIVNKYIYILHFCFNNNFFHSKKAEKYKTDAHQQLSTRPDTKPGTLAAKHTNKKKTLSQIWLSGNYQSWTSNYGHKYGSREIIISGKCFIFGVSLLGSHWERS